MRKNLFLLMIVTMLLSYTHVHADEAVNSHIPQIQLEQTKRVCTPTIRLLDNTTVAQQGCCSWHGGVCGCQYGRVVCCDGSYSPSCTCKHDDKPIIIN